MDYKFQRENRFPTYPCLQKLVFQKISLVYQLSDEVEKEKSWLSSKAVFSILQSCSDEWALGGPPQKQAGYTS